MNKDLYKLVYSQVLNMMVPVSEAARSRSARSSKRVRKALKSLLSFTFFISYSFIGNSWADTVLPAGLSVQTMVGTQIKSSDANSVNFQQLAPKAIVDWNTLNLGKNQQFNVDMQASWSMLNRIHDTNASLIDGLVNGKGNLFFINTNGIIFGANAQFNTGSLYAGTLDITDKLFNEGFIQPGNGFKPVFNLVGAVGKQIKVEKGAVINTANGGKVLLFAENVENSGVINTPDGQTILAAGKKVYLQDSSNPAGFFVEVEGGGTATNLGTILADRGNITMMGLAVKQAGTLQATTSVRANGSIYLQGQTDSINTKQARAEGDTATRVGSVELTDGSVTQILPELQDKEEINHLQAFKYADEAQSGSFKKSEVVIDASIINDNGKIVAKGGNVSLISTADAPADLLANTGSEVARRIYLGDKAVIDVSGVDASAPMSRNQYEVQLYSGELKDAPILRDSKLYKEIIFIDARKGIAQNKDSLVLDITPLEKLSKLTVAEALTKGGTVKLSAQDADVVVSKGSKIDVSGGSTTYLAGNIKETNLIENGKLVPISEAKTGVLYQKTQDVIIDKDAKWGVTRAYDVSGGGTNGWGKTVASNTQAAFKTVAVGKAVDSYFNGDDAGTFSVADRESHPKNLVLAGEVLANTKISSQQLINQIVPKGGTFSVGANDLVVANQAKQLASDFSFNKKLADNYQSVINTDFLANGFNNIGLGGTINATMQFKPNGSLDFRGGTINADIIAPGANINFSGATAINNAKIITAGNFTNDTAGIAGALTQVAAVDGGSISALGKLDISQQLTLGDNVVMDTSAGARISNSGQVIKGKAGNIKYVEISRGNNITQKAFGFDKGGELDITSVKALNIAGNNNKSTDDTDIDKSLLSENGFSKITLNAGSNSLTIGDANAAAQEIFATQKTWQLNSGIKNLSNSQNFGDVATSILLPEVNRKPVSLSFSSDSLTLAENTAIRTDAGGSVSLKGVNQLNVLGSIITPGGNINLSLLDTDFTAPANPTQNLFIGSKAVLSAEGTTLTAPDSQPKLLKTKVINAGTINVTATKGSIIVKEGATLDVSAASVVNDTQTINGYQRETLYGDAGSINFAGNLALDGTVKGVATGTGRAGTLSADIDTITKQKQLQASNLNVGAAINGAIKSAVSEAQIKEGGFANLAVKSNIGFENGRDNVGAIGLDNGLDLVMAGNISLDATTLKVNDNGVASISASNLTLKNKNASVADALDTGTGQLNLNAKQLYIDNQKSFAFAGVNKTNINATLDIHGNGELKTNGELNLTARQIYPNTGYTLGFNALGDGSKVVVNSNGQTAKTPLSAQGTLNITADTIVQNGVLTAPFGEINLDAKKLLTLTSSSVTSISANNELIPFSTTNSGGSVYEVQYDQQDQRNSLHDKKITLKGEKVDLQSNAKVDVSAGGDMFASEWIDGAGGSKDIFLQPDTYAILPSLGAEFAPVDTKLSVTSAPVGLGKTVYLTGVPGLADGNYTLLPARYALMPGAFMVQANPTVGVKQLPKQATQQLDGTTLTAGYFGDLGTGKHDANWTTFKVTDGAVFRPAVNTVSRAPAEYKITNASQFFSDPRNSNDQAVPLPVDVGRLGFDAKQLNLDGTIVANKAKDANGTFGNGLAVDINATNIRVVSNKGTDDGSLQLTASSVNALKADSVLLGGSRKVNNGLVNISTGAETVSIENDAVNSINLPEIIATATNKVTVKAGAAIDTGAASTKPNKIAISADGNGALLALSSSSDITYSRTNVVDASTNGELSIENSATLKAGNSVVLDATKSAKNSGIVSLQDGGSATLGANNIVIGNAPAVAQGLALNTGVIAALGQLKSLALNSYNNIDTFGAINFGNDKLNLSMNAASITGHLATGETAASVPANAAPSIITADTFTLKNTTGVKPIIAVDNAGRALTINANNVRLEGRDVSNANTDAGKTQITGFTQLAVNANEIRVAKTGETNFNVAATKLNAGRITADSAANFSLKSSDQLETAQPAAITPSVNTVAKNGIGATLNIAAKDLTIGSRIDVDSGKLNLTSTNDLTLSSSANISAKSASETFYNRAEYAPAGSVTLTSSAANVNVNNGVVIDVTGQNQADAGKVIISAIGGTANITGNLKGAAIGTGKGGVLEIDVKTLADLTNTNSQADGFSESRNYRVRTGDVNVSGTGNKALNARDINVVADTGAISVTGDVIATAPKNSHIALQANKNLTLASTANLKANSTQAGEEGGRVELATKAGVLNLQTGSIVDVSGGAGAEGGKVSLRTLRANNTATALAGNTINTTINGAKSIVLEAVKVFAGITKIATGTANSGGSLGFTTVDNDVKDLMTNKDAIVASLGKTDDANFHLRAGEEIQSTGNLEVSNDWNLYSANRAGNEPGVLTIRAKGNVDVKGTISDGFEELTAASKINFVDGKPKPTALGVGESWAYNIVAGADFSSADKLATADTGNFTLANAKIIRTGTGNINIAAGGNLVMGNANSVIYTAGAKAEKLDGFVEPASTQYPLYLTNGGDVNVNVKGDITGKESSSKGSLVNNWLFRGGSATQDSSWWARPDLFSQGVATFGGGDVTVKAGGNIKQFSAAAATSARFDSVSTDKTKFDTNGNPLNKVINGGGDVIVEAGKNIINGVYFVAKGDGTIKAGDSINTTTINEGTTLLLQDGNWKVSTTNDALIDAVSNPTLLVQSKANIAGTNYFNSYGDSAGAAVNSINGNVNFSSKALDNYFPSKLKLVAFDGNVEVTSAKLLPAAQGDLKLLAANNLTLGNITVSDAAVNTIASASKPISASDFSVSFNSQVNTEHDPQLLHKNDAEPVLIIANNGEINGSGKVTTPKVTKVVAGGNIKDVQFNIQNNQVSDISLIKAGNDVGVDTVVVSGPGELLMQAGRDIDLTQSKKYSVIVSTGNGGYLLPGQKLVDAFKTANPALPKDGSSITFQAGLGKEGSQPNVQGYIDQYILPVGSGPSTLQNDTTKLTAYRLATSQSLTSYMQKVTGNAALSDSQALELFNTSSSELKNIFVNRHLSSELATSAQDYLSTKSDERGFAALAKLFTTKNIGDILMFNNKVATTNNGSIDFVAPGGKVIVGLNNKPINDIGVLTEKGGNISMIADGDILVNNSKVITEYGGDLLLYSDSGNIDAGKGSKSAVSVPQRFVSTDKDGNTTVDIRAVAIGSGIRTETFDEDGPNGSKKAPARGNAALSAPRGFVNAGEAGISSNNLLIRAPVVLNADNIQVQGASTGVPIAAAAAPAGLGATTSPASVKSAVAAVAESVAQSANKPFTKPALPSIISVDIISIGK